VRVLLSDGSGLTARQCATRLAAAGHSVHVLSSDPVCLCRFTRCVKGVRRVPPFGPDPPGWLDAALAVYAQGGFDVLFPTQEQVAVLAWAKGRLDAAGVRTVVPTFDALAEVQDKIAATATLERLGLPQPHSTLDARGWDRFPAFVKDPIGTASGGVRRVTTAEELREATRGRHVVVQEAVEGPLCMCQSVFDRGTLVAFHANLRLAEGSRGGASHKRGVALPGARDWFEVLGSHLSWHGALSADVILTGDGPLFIDINPRLVEPQNAYLSGVDLVGAMLELATGSHPAPQAEGQVGVTTHQLLLAILGAAEHRGRRGVLIELSQAVRHADDYVTSTEELTPTTHDARSALPVALATAATLASPGSWTWFSSSSVSAYALTPEGWDTLRTLDPT